MPISVELQFFNVGITPEGAISVSRSALRNCTRYGRVQNEMNIKYEGV